MFPPFPRYETHRRGNKAVAINGVSVDASRGAVDLHDGDVIQLGGFSFVFKTEVNEELTRYGDPAEMISDIENHDKQLVAKLPQSKVPYYLQESLTFNGVFSWDNAYFKDYRKVIFSNWNDPLFTRIRCRFDSRQSFIDQTIEINQIRNTVMHPSKGQLCEKEKRKLVSYYVRFFEA